MVVLAKTSPAEKRKEEGVTEGRKEGMGGEGEREGEKRGRERRQRKEGGKKERRKKKTESRVHCNQNRIYFLPSIHI